MFFLMSKILIPLLEPLTYVLLLVIVALIFSRKSRLRKICLVGALFILFVFGTPFVPHMMIRFLETRHAIVSPLPCVDAAIVLAGVVNLEISSSEYIEFGGGVERILTGIQLVQEGIGERLVIVGGSGSLYDQRKREAVILRKFAIDFGVPEKRILIEPDSRNTYENAVNAKVLLEQHKLSSSILITTASHLPRAMGCFKKIGLTPLPYPVDFHSNPHPRYHILDILPNVGNLKKTSMILHEYIGLLSYKLAGYL